MTQIDATGGARADSSAQDDRRPLGNGAGRGGTSTFGQGTLKDGGRGGQQGGQDIDRAAKRFSALIAGAGGAGAEAPVTPAVESSADQRASDREPGARRDDAPFQIAILPGDRVGPATVQSPHDALRTMAQVDKVMAAMETQIARGETAQVARDARGGLTLNFPLPSIGLGLDSAQLRLDGRTLDLVLTGAGAALAASEASLRELARALALRHPTRIVRLSVDTASQTGAIPGEADESDRRTPSI